MFASEYFFIISVVRMQVLLRCSN